MKNFRLNFESIVQRKARWLLILTAFFTLGVGQMEADDDNTRTVFLDISACNWYLNDNYVPRIWVAKNDAKSDTYEIGYTEIVATNVYRFEIDKGARCIQFFRYKSGSPESKINWTGDIWINDGSSSSACCYQYHNYFKLDNSGADGYKVSDDNKTSFQSTGEYLYFYANNLTTKTAVQFVMGRWNHYATTNMSLLTNTNNLYYCTGAYYNDAYSYFSIMGNGSSWPSNSKGFNDISSNASDYTAAKYGYKFNTGSTYYATKSSTSKGAAISIESKTGYSAIPEYTTTLNIKVREATGGDYTNGSASDKPASTIKITGTYMNGNGSTNRSDATWTTGSSCSYKTVISGKVTPTYATLDDNWQFDGWYIGASSQGTGTSFDFYQSANTTVEARFTRIKYDINLNNHGATTSGTTKVLATYGANTNLTSNISVPSKTGYTFGGYYTGENGTGTLIINASGAWQTGNSLINASGNWTNVGHVTLHANWTAHTYSVRFNKNDAGATGSMDDEAFTYGTAKTLTANAFQKNGYSFDYWTTNDDGTGTQYTNGKSVSNLTSTNGGIVNLYAHWTEVNLTDLTFAPATAAPETDVTITPILSGIPTGTSSICWALYYDSECTDLVEGITFTSNPSSGNNNVTFTTPTYSGAYYVKGTYRAGNDCDGSVLGAPYVERYVVASDHTVTIKHVCNGVEIAPRSSVVIEAASTAEVTALSGNAIFGYSFSSWTLGDGISSENSAANPITISANYDGTLTANYSKKNIIFFKDNLGWTDPANENAHVYVHLKTSNDWNTTRGTGNQYNYYSRNNEMSRVPGTSDIFYYDYTGTTITQYIVFTKYSYDDYESFTSNNLSDPAQCVYPTNPYPVGGATGSGNYGFNATTPMFVPLTKEQYAGQLWNSSYAIYFNRGYWVNYIGEETGYILEIYKSDGSTLLQSKKFTSADKLMSMTATVDLEAGTTYKFLLKRGSVSCGNTGTMKVNNSGTSIGWRFAATESTKCGIITAAAGDYTFSLSYSAGDSEHDLRIGVTYPSSANDYRVVYKDRAQWSKAAHDANWYHPSRVISKRANGEDIISFYVSKAVGANASLTLQQISAIDANTGAITWNAGTDISSALSGISESGVYNFKVAQDGSGNVTVTLLGKYEGDYYIRTANAGTTGWADFQAIDHLMVYSDYAEDNNGYSHYYMKWCPRRTNVKFVIANDYSMCISDTLDQDYKASDGTFNQYNNLTTEGELYYEQEGGKQKYDDENAYKDKYSANIRFMWNQATNKISRAYLSGATDASKRALVLQGQAGKLLDENGDALVSENPGNNATMLADKQSWIYDVSVKVVPGGKIVLYARYNSYDQYLIGTSSDVANDGVELIGANGGDETPYPIRVVYDFKINRIVSAWEPTSLSTDLTINADVMIVREHQGAAQNIELNTHTLTTEKTVYGVMRFNKYVLNNLRNGTTTPLDLGDQLPLRQRNHYYISFPFDVNVSDIFGFGQYGVHWVLEYYDGAARAKSGLWADPGMTYWKYLAPTGKLKANEGYLLALSPSQMSYTKTGSGEVWDNSKEEVELYFPASEASASISEDDIIVDGLGDEYKCGINRGDGTEGDRRIADSYWRCIGVPSFTEFDATLYRSYTDAETNVPISWASTPQTITDDVHYLYDINWTDYSLRPVTGSSFNFKPMHAYMVQNKSQIIWRNASAFHHVSSIVARRQRAEDIHDFEIRLELNQNGEQADQAFVRLTDDENVTAGFEFGHDMSKAMYSTKANLFTYIGYEPVAANSMPYSEGTTIVPVGLKLATDGDYTFALPEGTSGVGVTLVDNVENIRTNLSALDYTVNLTAGDYTNRFTLEISPIKETPTSIEEVSSAEAQAAGVRKVIIDGVLYIVKDGKMYDARGSRVQ